jgi:hypothetical protein
MPMGSMCAGANIPIASYMIPMAIALAVIFIRSSRARRLRVELLWVRPLIIAIVFGAGMVTEPPVLSLLSLAILTTGLVLGCALGWQRGKLMRIDVDPQTHELTSQASPVGLVLIVGLMFVRFGARGLLCQYAQTSHLPVIAISDALTLFIVGVFVVQGVEMWLRARRLLAEARAGSAIVS